ncbi:MAG: SDR family oxidoreductase [Chloroflexi bacterium]|nr:SDR family oxidoreductase [Chloroflexota bacterium]
MVANTSVADDANRVVAETVPVFGRLDVLVNNAGIYPPSPVLSMTAEGWDSVLGTKLRWVFFYSQAAAGRMIKAGNGGRIINIAPWKHCILPPNWRITMHPREGL